MPQSEAPSTTPSMQPSTSAEPTSSPSTSGAPSDLPSQMPSLTPSITEEPSVPPSVSIKPSGLPSDPPSMTQAPSLAPSISHVPSISFEPTPVPTSRHVFEEDFMSADIGYVGAAGASFETDWAGLYQVQGSGSDIWVRFWFLQVYQCFGFDNIFLIILILLHCDAAYF